jgi:gamma-glutamyltranspeptidase/glutathione hydrolase
MSIDSLSAKTGEGSGLAALRPVVMGTRHMISAGHYLAAQAGMQILEAGGNAVDAGVAAGLVLGVVQSDMVSIAGVAPIMIYLADAREVVTISGLGPWPRAASVELFQREHGGQIPVGVRRTVVPAAPHAWITALHRYGTMDFAEVADAAIRFASDGFPMHAFLSDRIKENVEAFRRWPSNAEIYLPRGRPPEPGEVFVQSDLGAVLRYMADEERHARRRGRRAGLHAARDAFYLGDVAARIVKYHQEHGGLLTAADLANFRVKIEPPERAAFGPYEVCACGPWCQGPVLLQALNLLEGFDLRAMGHNSGRYIHTVTEALKLAFADRERFYGDPAFVQVPMAGLLAKEYAACRRGLIHEDKAWPELPPAGDPWAFEALGAGRPAKPAPAQPGGPDSAGLDTSYVCVVDRYGNGFSATPSDVSTDTPVIPGTGLALSSRGSQSRVDPAHPACLAPGKRPRLTPNPALALKEGKLFMPFGTPGGDVQAQAMLQAFLNFAVFGLNPQAAVEAPRFATYSFPDSFAPHRYFPGRLNLEARIDRAVGEQLRELGHTVTWWPDWIWRAGAVCAIVVNQETGVLQGAADPRRQSYAMGW